MTTECTMNLMEFTLSNGEYNIPVTVPDDITAELFSHGKIENPLFGTNAEQAKWIAEEDWTYETKFSVSEELFGKRNVSLVFEGIDTLSEIEFNGVVLGKTENMFLRYAYDVKNLLLEKDNVLRVKIFSPNRYIREKNDGTDFRALFTQDRVYIRKAQCHWGWDWAAPLPGMGIYLPAYLTGNDGVTIESVHVEPFLSGDVRFRVKANAADGSYKFRLTVDGNMTEFDAKEGTNILNFKIDEPKLWWPNGYGEPHLYGYRIELLHNEISVCEKFGKFGIREIKLLQAPVGDSGAGFAFSVNGRKIFCKGSNWVPCSNFTGAISDKTYADLIFAAKNANFNILRVWGGGIYEKDLFYELCDENGIMVWQDFMFSCSAVPVAVEGLEENFLREAAYQLTRLRNHACIALWCGGNEYMPHCRGKRYAEGNKLIRVTLRGLCGEYDASRAYIHNSPVGFTDDEWETKTGDTHYSCADKVSETEDYDYRKLIAAAPVMFASESAHLGPARLRSLKKFIPRDELRNFGASWDYHFLGNPYAIKPETFLKREQKFAAGLFGAYDCVEDFVKKAMLAHAEMLRVEIEYCRAEKKCRGFMNWMFNDNWGCGTWSVVDWYGEKKPAYYAMKRAFAPIKLMFTEHEGKMRINLCNDAAEAIDGIVKVCAKTFDGKVAEDFSCSLHCLPDSVARAEIALSEYGDYLTAELEGYPASEIIHIVGSERGKKYADGLRYTIERIPCGYSVTVKACEFARCVFVDCADNDGIEYSDNFFDMEKDGEKIVLMKTDKKLGVMDISVLSFANVWKE